MTARKHPFLLIVILFAWVLGASMYLITRLIGANKMDGLFSWQLDRFYHLAIASVIWLVILGVLSIVLLLRDQLGAATILPGNLPFNIGNRDRFRIAKIFLGCLVLAFLIGNGWLSIARHQRFNSTGYDLAINEQIVWNTVHGRFFASSPEVDNSFADHFRPFLLVLVPVYSLVPSPLTLLVVQTLVLAAGVIPLFQLANRKTRDPLVAVILAAVYLLYPALGYINRFDFHIEVFAIPAFIAAADAVDGERWKTASLWLLIPLLCKENMGLTVAAFGLYVLIAHRNWKIGTAWVVIGLFFFIGTSFWLIPAIRGENSDTLSRYNWLGETPTEMIDSIFTNPSQMIEVFLAPDRMLMLVQLLMPVGFFALAGLPELMLAIPGLALNMLAKHHCQPSIYCQYTVPIVPFVFVATVFGLVRFVKNGLDQRVLRLMVLGLLPLAINAWIIDNPFFEDDALPNALRIVDNADTVVDALEMVAAGDSLVTTNDYAPHLAQREQLYLIGIPAQRKAPSDPDAVFINLYDQEYIVCDQYRKYLNKLDADRYGIVFRTGGLIVIRRDSGSIESFRDFISNWNNCAG